MDQEVKTKAEPMALELEPQREHPAPAVMQQQQVMPARAPTAIDMIAEAVRRGATVEEIGQLMDLKDRMDAADARKAFVAAMAAFKRNPPKIIKDKAADFKTDKGRTYYTYADLAAVCSAVTSALAEHGLSHDWSTSQHGNAVTVTCTITHELGHSKSTTLTANADKTGSKNDIQAIGSAVSYLERYTLLAACGIAVSDGSDDDGAAADGGEPINRNAVKEAVQERRARETPVQVAGRRAGVEKPAKPASPELLKLAREAAMDGSGKFGKFMLSCTPGERKELMPELESLQAAAAQADKG